MTLRIAIHDFGGHPFSLQLAGELARRGCQVGYFFCPASGTPNAGRMEGPDVPGLEVQAIPMPRYDKRNFLKRKLQETRYGGTARKVLAAWAPDVLISSCVPLDAQVGLTRWAKAQGIRHLFWFQDIASVAVAEILKGRLGPLAKVVAALYERKERQVAQLSDGVINIAPFFETQCLAWGLERNRLLLQPNWAVADRLPVRPKDNAWSRDKGLQDTFNLVYTGTLGMKQRPEVLLQLAESFRDQGDVRVVVVSAGAGTEWLRAEKARLGLEGLVLLPFASFEAYPDVLGTADVLVTIQDRGAGKYCVPSKVLSYLCANRYQALMVDPDNPAAQMVRLHGRGVVVPPGEDATFVEACHRLHQERPSLGSRAGIEAAFDIERIGGRFLAFLQGLPRSTGEARTTQVPSVVH